MVYVTLLCRLHLRLIGIDRHESPGICELWVYDAPKGTCINDQ